MKEKIEQLEKELLTAMVNSDVSMLDKLIHDDLLFTMPNGHTGTKQSDLEAYREGTMMVEEALASDSLIHKIDNCFVVAVTVALKARYQGHIIDGPYRYTRVWKNCDGHFKIIGGACVALASG